MLLNMGLMTELDRAALCMYCTAWARHAEAEDAMRQHGVLVRGPGGMPMASPYLAIANTAMAQMRSILAEFGMTPATRSRVHAVERGGRRPVRGAAAPEEGWSVTSSVTFNVHVAGAAATLSVGGWSVTLSVTFGDEDASHAAEGTGSHLASVGL